MNTRRKLGLFLLVGGLLVVGASGYLWRGDTGRRAEIRAEMTALEDSADRLHDRLVQTSLKYRAFQSTLSEVPDSIRRYGARQTMDIGNNYHKTIRKLDLDERDVRLKIRALERERNRERARAGNRAAVLAVAGAAAALGGALMLISRRGVGA